MKPWGKASWLLFCCMGITISWFQYQLQVRDNALHHHEMEKIRATASWTQYLIEMERKNRRLAHDIDKRFQAGEEHARTRTEATIAALRADALQLRQRLSARSTWGKPATGVATSSSDDASLGGLRGTDAEFLVRLADEADSRVRQLEACQEWVHHQSSLTHGSSPGQVMDTESP